MAPRLPALVAIPLAVTVIGLLTAVVAYLGGRQDHAVRRYGLIGGIANGMLLTTLVLAVFTAHREKQASQVGISQIRELATRTADEFGGWYGRLAGQRTSIFATQIDLRSPAGKVFVDSFARPFTLVVFGVDNRGGHRDLEIDLSTPLVFMADGSSHQGLPRREVLAAVQQQRDEFAQQHAGVYRVAPGQLQSNALCFLAAQEKMEQVVGISILLNGKPTLIPGRYLSAEDKLARRRSRAAGAAQ